MSPLLDLERLELELYRFVEGAGVGRGRSVGFPTLAVQVGCTEHPVLTELLKELHSSKRIYLGKYFGQTPLSYEEWMSKVNEETFFYSGPDLFIRVLGEGWRRLQHLEQRQAEALQQDGAPKTALSIEPYGFHSEIERVSGALFRDGHYKQAALEAYIRVITAVRDRSALELDGDDLMGQAFGSQNRTPVIQFNALQTEAERDEQRGLMFLYKGLVGLRNSKAHSNTLFDDASRAHEYLALASLLMRLLEIATVHPIPERNNSK